MNDVVFECLKCSQLLEAPEDMAGMFVECPNCRQVIQVPAEGSRAPAERDRKEQKPEEDAKSSTIRIELPPNLGIPETPKRRITIRRGK